ncbi:MAG: PQQ-binding-like beta-propeller repeat protein [Flavobacteriales bacterium]
MQPLKRYALFIGALFTLAFSFAQPTSDWPNGGGNQGRNGQTQQNGPDTDSLLYQITAAAYFGTPVLIENDRFVTMRFLALNNAPIHCFDLNTGESLWVRDVTSGTGRSIPIGFKNDLVYAIRWTESLQDSLIALDAATGNTVWTSNETISTSITRTANFTNEGHLLVEAYDATNSSGLIKCINYTDGTLLWSTPIIPGVISESEVTVVGNTGYVVETIGGSVHVSAINLITGEYKYTHAVNDTHPGGAAPQSTLSAGPDGVLYYYKNEDNITAFADNGDSLELLWELETFGNHLWSQICVGHDGNIYGPSNGRLIKISPSGELLDSTYVLSQGNFFILKATAAANGNIYLTNGQDSVFAFTQDLQKIWSDFIQSNNTSGAAIASSGQLIVSGLNYVKVYAPSDNLVGSDELEKEMGFLAFPNPAESVVQFQVPQACIHQPYQLIDLNGRIIQSGIVSQTKTSLDVRQMAEGEYFLYLPLSSKTIPTIKK